MNKQNTEEAINQTETEENWVNDGNQSNTVPLPDGPIKGNGNQSLQLVNREFTENEKQRRVLFIWAIGVALIIIVALYGLLAYLLICKGNNNWHVIALLILPATTILFTLIRTLSPPKKQQEEQNHFGDFTVTGKSLETIQSTLESIKDILNLKK